MGHRAIHPNLCLASRNTYSRSTLGDLEKITEQLEWWAPPYFLFASRLTTRAAATLPSVLHVASSMTFALFLLFPGALSVRMPTKMFEQ